MFTAPPPHAPPDIISADSSFMREHRRPKIKKFCLHA